MNTTKAASPGADSRAILPVKFNRDGTAWSAMSVQNEIDGRLARNSFADVSDLIGADWGCAFPIPRSADEYAANAAAAREVMYGNF